MAKSKDPLAGVTLEEVTIKKLAFPKRASEKRKEEILNHLLDGTNRFTWVNEGEIWSVFKDDNGTLQFCYEHAQYTENLEGGLCDTNSGEIVPVPVNDRGWRQGPTSLGYFGEHEVLIQGNTVTAGCQEMPLNKFKKFIQEIHTRLNG